VKPRVTILGAGFAGMELATQLSEELGDDVAVTLIDESDAFVFGFSKLDVMFGRTTLDAVRLPYRRFVKAGVRFEQEKAAKREAEPLGEESRTTSVWAGSRRCSRSGVSRPKSRSTRSSRTGVTSRRSCAASSTPSPRALGRRARGGVHSGSRDRPR
jgi:hypothetical protein